MFSKKMLLTTPATYQNKEPVNGVKTSAPTFLRFSNISHKPITQLPIQMSPPSSKGAVLAGGDTVHKAMKWGEPTWFLFHTLSVKIKEEEFTRVKDDLLSMVYSICVNLPCPICSDHAKEYLKTINFRAIHSKSQLIDFFHQFHNTVNKRKQKESFPRDQVEEKYSKAYTQNIFLYFQQGFQDKSFNPKHISDQYIRQRVLNKFNEWFYKNAHAFDL